MPRVTTILAAVAAALSVPAAAGATCNFRNDPFPPQTSYQIFHDPAHAKVVLFSGDVRENESKILQQVLQQNPDVAEVWLHSPGGIAIEGMRMGRILRDAGLVTRIRSRGQCYSACSMAFAGGMLRVVEPGGMYGVHMFSAAGSAEFREQLRRGLAGDAQQAQDTIQWTEQFNAQVAAEQAKYLLAMGLSVRLNDLMVRTEAKGMRCLQTSELQDFNVTNLVE